MISSEQLAEYIGANFIDGVAFLDESETGYLVRTKNGTREISKQHITEWLAGGGAADKSIERYGKNDTGNNFVSEREKNLEKMRENDKVLEAWYAQRSDARLEFAMDEAKASGKDKAPASKGINYKGAEYYKQQAESEA